MGLALQCYHRVEGCSLGKHASGLLKLDLKSGYWCYQSTHLFSGRECSFDKIGKVGISSGHSGSSCSSFLKSVLEKSVAALKWTLKIAQVFLFWRQLC